MKFGGFFIKDKIVITAVKNSLDILYFFTRSDESISLDEISFKFPKISKSTVYRMLQTLVYCGYINQDSNTKKYSLGLKSLEIGGAYLNRLDLRKKAHEIMSKALVNLDNETMSLGILQNDEIVIIDKIEKPNQNVKISASIGKRFQLHCGGVAKAVLAAMSDEEIMIYLRNREAESSFDERVNEKKTKTNEEILKAVEKTRAMGYSYSEQEIDSGVFSIGVAIMGAEGKVVGGISVAGILTKMVDKKYIQKIGEYAKSVADEISKAIGYMLLN